MMVIEEGLGDADGGIEIVVGQGRVEDFVAVVPETGRLSATWNAGPAVEEEDLHVGILTRISCLDPSPSSGPDHSR